MSRDQSSPTQIEEPAYQAFEDLEPFTCLPEQLIEPNIPTTGCHRLVAALIESAVRSATLPEDPPSPRYYLKNRKIRQHRSERQRERDEAWDWLLSNEEYFFSFRFCCTLLGWHPDAIREGIKRKDIRRKLMKRASNADRQKVEKPEQRITRITST